MTKHTPETFAAVVNNGIIRQRASWPALPVLFRAEKSGPHKGEVTAVFPTLAASSLSEMTCYAHVGQHSGCTMEWYNATRLAKPEEYADLLAELKGIYENPQDDSVRLVIYKRVTAAHYDERVKTWRHSHA